MTVFFTLIHQMLTHMLWSFIRGNVIICTAIQRKMIFNQASLEELAALAGFSVSFFRTEWLDIYYRDVMALQDNFNEFIHKRNSHLPGYEEHIKTEDELQSSMDIHLGSRGNYIVAVLSKC